MNRVRIIAIASILTPVAVGLTLGLATTAGAAATTRDAAANGTRTVAVTASATAPKFVLLGCDNNAEVAPTSISNCGDGAVGVKGLHWTSWTSHLASGYGTYFLNDCTPTCVGGHFHSYPALVTLWGSAAVTGRPTERKYTEMTLIFTGPRPPASQVVNGKTVITHPITLTLPAFP